HLGGYFWEGLCEEVCRSHAGLHSAEWVFDCLSTLAHRLRVGIKAMLHRFEQMLMLPPRNPPLRPRRALGFDRAILTGRSPVAPYPLAVFLAREAIRQLLPIWTAIGVFLRQIGKVLLAEASV